MKYNAKRLQVIETRIHGDVVIVVFKNFSITTNKKGFEAIKRYIK